jgi:hypothetical protein
LCFAALVGGERQDAVLDLEALQGDLAAVELDADQAAVVVAEAAEGQAAVAELHHPPRLEADQVDLLGLRLLPGAQQGLHLLGHFLGAGAARQRRQRECHAEDRPVKVRESFQVARRSCAS